MSARLTYTLGVGPKAAKTIEQARRRLRAEAMQTERAIGEAKDGLVQAEKSLQSARTDVIKRWKGKELDEASAIVDQAREAIRRGDPWGAPRLLQKAADRLVRCAREANEAEARDLERQHVAKSILLSLEQMGFSVEVDLSDPEDPASDVILVAGKPSGKCVAACIDLAGGIQADFSGYESPECLEDAREFEERVAATSGLVLRAGEPVMRPPQRLGGAARRLPRSKTRGNL